MLALGAAGLCDRAAAAAPAHADPVCNAPEYRQFDFWLGDWEVFDTQARSSVARLQVQSILNGCVLLEIYRDLSGNEGRSFSIYDATRGVWHQSWVTNHGHLLIIEGQFHDGVMQLTGTDLPAPGGARRLVRGTWQATKDGVREIAVRSNDAGKTWQPWFDLLMRPRGRGR